MDSSGSQPWIIRPPAAKGDSDPNEIYANIGRALANWEELEARLAELFDCMVSGAEGDEESSRAGMAAFIAVPSSSSRHDMLAAAAQYALAISKYLQKVVDLVKDAKSFASRRNEIAHGRVLEFGSDGYFLMPNTTKPQKWETKGDHSPRQQDIGKIRTGSEKYKYVGSDISFYAEQFSFLTSRSTQLIQLIFLERGGKGADEIDTWFRNARPIRD